MGYVQSLGRSDLKEFWKYINRKRKSNSLPSTMVLNNQIGTDTSEISEMFADYFKSVFKPSSIKEFPSSLTDNSISVDLSLDDVIFALKNLKPAYYRSSDQIPAILLKKCSYVLAYPLFLIFKRSLEEGIFPSKWKTSFINPIFKDGDRSLITNYRPVSLISPIANLFEGVLYNKLIDQVIPKLSVHQHGFIPGKSVVTNLLDLADQVTEAFERGCQVDAIYLDMTKAFDSVDHSLLLDKLCIMGFDRTLLAWFKSYLENRSQLVHINGIHSQKFIATSGILQGSRLGPLLFAIFINGIVSEADCTLVSLFADDCRISRIVSDPKEASAMQSDLDKISSWISKNKLDINLKKCFKISFSRGSSMLDNDYLIDGQKIKKAEKVRDLGIILDEKWTFSDHIAYLLPKAFKTLGFVKRVTSNFTSLSTITYLFKALILPGLTYASVIWSPMTQEKFSELNSVLKKFLRYASFKNGSPMAFDSHDYSYISATCGITKLESLHHYLDVSFVLENLKGKLKCNIFDNRFHLRELTYCLRNHRPYKESTHTNNYIAHSPSYRLVERWNVLDVELRAVLLEDINTINKDPLKQHCLKNF